MTLRPVWALAVEALEVPLPGAAHGAEPVVRDVLERRSGRDAAVRIALVRVVDEPAGRADVLLFRDRLAHAGEGYRPLCEGVGWPRALRRARARGGAQSGRGHRGSAGSLPHPAARRVGRTGGAAGPAQSRAALHARRLGLPRG